MPGTLSIYEEIKKEESGARDPSATYQDEIRQLERNRQHAPPPPQRVDDGYQQEVGCPQCGQPLRLIHGKRGPFYRHPRMIGLGCDMRFDAQDLEIVLQAAEQRKQQEVKGYMCGGCSEWALPGEAYCASCLSIAKARGMI